MKRTRRRAREEHLKIMARKEDMSERGLHSRKDGSRMNVQRPESTVENSHLNFSAVIWGIFTTYFRSILWPRTLPVYVAFVVRIENLISWHRKILKSCFWTPNTNFPRGIRVTLSPDVLSPRSWKFVFCLAAYKVWDKNSELENGDYCCFLTF